MDTFLSKNTNQPKPFLSAPLQIEERAICNLNYQRFSNLLAPSLEPIHFGLLRFNSVTSSAQIHTTVYYFHAGDGNDQQGLDTHIPESLNALYQENSVLMTGVQIVLVGLGASFLHDHVDTKRPPYSSFFFEQLIKITETGTSTTAMSRWLLGISMGGFAALSALLRRPDLFAGADAISPALVQWNIDDLNVSEKYSKKASIPLPVAQFLEAFFKAEFMNNEDFNKYNPLSLITHAKDIIRLKKISIEVGKQDQLGLVDGCKTMHELLNAREIPHHFKIYEGIHDLDFARSRMQPALKRILF